MTPLAWSALLLLIGLALVILEVFLPSGGVIGFLSVSSLAAAVIMAFSYGGLEQGLVFLSLVALGVPIMLVFAFRYWPHTPMGRRLLLEVPRSDQVLPDSPERRKLRQLIGTVGVARTDMLPSGAIDIAGQTIDALSDAGAISAGERVQVVEVHGGHIVVRPASDVVEEMPRAVAPDDIMSRPIESFGLEGFEEPLT